MQTSDSSETKLSGQLMAIIGNDNRISQAISLASEIHRGQTRDEGTPYIEHPIRVALIVANELGVKDPDLICAALLHDALETESGTTHENIRERFGDRVEALVNCLTDEFRNEKLSRAERKAKYLQRFSREEDNCVLIKLCDRLDNLRSLPLSPNQDKKKAMIQETSQYLMPLFEGKAGHFPTLQSLIEEALVQVHLKPYREHQQQYQELAEYLQGELKAITHRLGMHPILMGRAKALDSFAEKIQRPGKQYDDPLTEITDFCGVRVIVHTLDQVDVLAREVEKTFNIDRENSENKAERLKFKEFGYLSNHFVVHLKDVPKDKKHLAGLKAELQLRTLAQHVWADIYHEMGYKNEFQLPERWEREFAILAAALETCDRGFKDIKAAMSVYESNYQGYISRDKLLKLRARFRVVLRDDPTNATLAHRLIRVYLALEEHDKVREMLDQYADLLMQDPAALRDIGVAYCQAFDPKKPEQLPEFEKGQALLQRAIEIDPKDIDARCSLGGTWRKRGEVDKAITYYQEAHRLDPTNPYALGNYIAMELVRSKSADLVRLFAGLIPDAVERCRKQIEVHVNEPWSFFDMGTFHLYLGDIYSSLNWYLKGICSASAAWMVRSARSTIASFLENSVALEGTDLLDRTLRLAWWLRAKDEDKLRAGWSYAKTLSFDNSVLVVAGGCSGITPEDRNRLDRFREILSAILTKSSAITVISGGTKSGIAEVVGDLQEQFAGAATVRTVGYLPKAPIDNQAETLDTRYTDHRFTDGENFSPLEPIAFWEDFVGAGGDPKKVKVIGFNGGRIAAAEYRLALAFGAKVGIIKGSGREADALLADPQWKQYADPNLVEDPPLSALNLTEEEIGKFIRES